MERPVGVIPINDPQVWKNGHRLLGTVGSIQYDGYLYTDGEVCVNDEKEKEVKKSSCNQLNILNDSNIYKQRR